MISYSSVDALTNTRLDVLEACLGQVSQQSKGTLPHFRHHILHALEQQTEDVGANHKSLNVAAQSLCHSCSDKTTDIKMCLTGQHTHTLPDSRSRATIMNSLSGGAHSSGLARATWVWWRVWATRATQRWKTGSQYGRKPDCRAVATEDRHCKWQTFNTDTGPGLTSVAGSLPPTVETSLCLHLLVHSTCQSEAASAAG